MTNDRAQQFADALREFERGGELDAFVALFAEQAQLVRPETDQTERGRDGARRFWQQYLEQFDGVESTFERVTDGPVAVLEWTSTGRSRQGGELRYRGVSLLDHDDDGLVTRFATYYDTAAFALPPVPPTTP